MSRRNHSPAFKARAALAAIPGFRDPALILFCLQVAARRVVAIDHRLPFCIHGLGGRPELIHGAADEALHLVAHQPGDMLLRFVHRPQGGNVVAHPCDDVPGLHA